MRVPSRRRDALRRLAAPTTPRVFSPRVRTATAGAAGALLIASSTTGWRVAPAVPLGWWTGVRAERALRDKRAAALARAAGRSLPDLLDRMSICVHAGMSVERTLRTIAERAEGPMGEALHRGLRALEAGVPRRDAYEQIARHAGAGEVAELMSTLARAESFGTPVAQALESFAADLRSRLRAEAEAEARTAPVKLVFPLVFCFLPAFVLLTVAPIAISAVRSIGGL